MATDPPSQGPRRHFHRGRRGHDRRGGERRGPQQQSQASEREQPSRGEHGVDVEQIMREIRSKIAQRHGVELTDQQVQELAARRLESILDPRTVKPALLDQLRKAAGTRPGAALPADKVAAPYEFEDTTLYETPNGLLRFIRKLLNPVLKLFFNPNPLIKAMHVQARLNTEAVKREAERDQRQAEWNALHYELLQRVVSEIAKVSLEVQNVSLRIESLAGKVDFNERRVRQIEGATYQGRPSGARERDRDRERERDRDRDQVATPAPAAVAAAAPVETVPVAEGSATANVPAGDAPRKRRRRRRGRRGGGAGEAGAPTVAGNAGVAEGGEIDEGDEADHDVEELLPEAVTTEGEAVVRTENDRTDAVDQPSFAPVEQPSFATEPPAPANIDQPAPERVTPQLEQIEPAAREVVAPDLQPAEPPEPEPDTTKPQ
jgi:hypothetical protein